MTLERSRKTLLWLREKMKDPEYRAHRNKKHNEWVSRNRDRLRAKARERNKRIREENPEKHKAKERKNALMKRYGMTVDDYENMLKSQGGVCLLCGGDDWCGRIPCVDHDHKTGIVRGLLCHRCNIMIGFIEKDKRLAIKMFDYLERGRV